MMYESTETAPARIYLQPVAAPSILGLFGFAGATFMVAANMAGWYGTAIIGAGYALIISALVAFYTASALMLAECYGHSVLGVGRLHKGARAPMVSSGCGEPGVIRGQSLNLEPQEALR